MYSEFDQETLDIDWFLTNGQEIAFMASAGGCLPTSVSKSAQNNEALKEYFEDLPYMSEIIINPFLKNFIKSKVSEQYLSAFTGMAMKGLYAFDRTNLSVFNDPNYHLVAKPVTPLKVNLLPPAIVNIIMETQFDGVMSLMFDISVLK